MIRALLAVLLLAAPSAGALTLLGDPGPGTMRVRVDDGNLSAKRLDGQPTINGSPAPEALEPLDVSMQSWRGFENVTHLPIDGAGRLLIADAASGLVIDLAVNETERAGNGSTSDEETGQPGETEPDEERPPSKEQDADAGPSSSKGAQNTSADGSRPGIDHPVRDDRTQRSAKSTNPNAEPIDESPDETGSSTVSTVAPLVVLGLLAAGAFAAERTKDSDENEPPELRP